ncbi:hypothetical protein GYH30_008475 [Glycine max]|nr:hypothetical protein GYH30_008475 [Glycine max]
MSKRESPAQVSLHEGHRILVEEAAVLVARYPQKVYSQMHDLVAKPYDSARRILDSVYLSLEAKEDSRGGVPIKDAVIAVPPYLGQADRRGLLVAAQLAGINVLSLINEHSGAALQYGIDKVLSDESRHVIFYDMGSSRTYAALVVWDRWNPELGGQNMELRLVEYFADEFNAQVSGIFPRLCLN